MWSVAVSPISSQSSPLLAAEVYICRGNHLLMPKFVDLSDNKPITFYSPLLSPSISTVHAGKTVLFILQVKSGENDNKLNIQYLICVANGLAIKTKEIVLMTLLSSVRSWEFLFSPSLRLEIMHEVDVMHCSFSHIMFRDIYLHLFQ